MNQIINKTKCCGCTACCYVCPKKCISMEPDDEGFLYPVVNEKICIQCGLCEKVCPVKHPAPNEEYTRQARILRCKDEQVLAFSTSGGLFVPLSKYILSQGGVVCAAGYDECFNVLHQIIEPEMWNEKTYQRFVGSKYVQSDMGESFRKIKIILEEKRKVLFWGTPCQVNGLKTYLHKKYENLITVDLVCHGTPSPKLWRKYLDYQVERYGSGIKEISFRNKKYGYHAGRMRIVFNNGKEYFASSKSDYMLKSFFRRFRPDQAAISVRLRVSNDAAT